jgi:superfamily II DNA or RNA helicase
MILRDYQQRAVDRLRDSLKTHRRTLLVLPTGGGKTVIFNHIASKANGRVLILVHRVELLRQTVDKYGGEIGTIEAGQPTPSTRVIVGMVQTVVNRLSEIEPPSIIIIDEAHHANATTWQRIVNNWSSYVIGVTATPCRADGSGLSETFEDMIIGSTMTELILQGYLVQPRCFAPTQIDTSQIRIQMGDFHRGDMLDVINKPSITGDVVSNYRTFADGKTAVVFCISVQHAIDVAEVFTAQGYPAAAIYGDMDKAERDRIVSELGKSVQVLCSCDLISEGFDVPNISAAILLRPTQSKGLYLQQVGRALRPSDGKSDAIILDHVGNCLRHGLPTDDHGWTLDAKKRKGRVQDDYEIHQCEKCYIVFEKSKTCPNCEHERAPTPREIEQREGELKEIKKIDRRRARTLDELIALGKQRGYKPGWAHKVYAARVRK